MSTRAKPTLNVETARVFLPLTQPARYKGAHGGRGSGKSHFFAGLLIEDSLAESGLRSVCIREVQKSLKEFGQAPARRQARRIQARRAEGFKVFREVIETPGDGIITFQGMQDHTAEFDQVAGGF